jgi:membrane protein DedA with SNARE-associated domain
MQGTDNPIISFLLGYAYEPIYVYFVISGLLIASSFGLPFPEEVTLLSAGLLAHIGSHPELYPPPYPGATGVNVVATATICFFAVLLSDLLVFALGKHFGPRLLKNRFAGKIFKPEIFEKIASWTERFGPFACGVFRFTPGLRFPGHFSCGCFGLSYTKFLLIDGTAALLTVPTQVLLMAYYGQEILGVLKNVKIVVGCLVVLGVIIFLVKRKMSHRKAAAIAGQLSKATNEKEEPQNHIAS